MKLRRILMLSLVMALGVIITGSVASARPSADLTEHFDWVFELECDGGEGFWSKAVFWWTHNGEDIGNKVVLRCTGSGDQTKYFPVPDEANDWHVKIVARDYDSGLWIKCFAYQSWTGSPPLVYFQDCVLANGMNSHFHHFWADFLDG